MITLHFKHTIFSFIIPCFQHGKVFLMVDINNYFWARCTVNQQNYLRTSVDKLSRFPFVSYCVKILWFEYIISSSCIENSNSNKTKNLFIFKRELNFYKTQKHFILVCERAHQQYFMLSKNAGYLSQFQSGYRPGFEMKTILLPTCIRERTW